MVRHTQPILLVEDSPEDYEAMMRGFKKTEPTNQVFHCSDGDEALDFLYRRGAYTDPTAAPRPGVILLDLNLPGTDGRQVLEQIKSDPKLKVIPVIVMSTSSDERDIQRCYEAGANSYIQKPIDTDSFMKAVQNMKEYWFHTTILPGAESTRP